MRARLAGMLILMTFFVTSGCTLRSYRSDSDAPVAAPLTMYESQVTVGPCIFSPPKQEILMAPILGALAASAISQGVSYLGNALNEAGRETNDKIVASRNLELTAKTFGPCVQIARGWFYRGFANDAEQQRELKRILETSADSAAMLNADRISQLWSRRMWVAAQPDFVFEAQLVVSSVQKPESKTLAWVPVYARLDRPVSRAWLRPSGSRNVAVFLAFHELNSDFNAPSATGPGAMVLGKLEPTVERRFSRLDSDTATQPNRHPSESKWFTVALGEQKKPMTVTTLVTEHQDAQPFLQFLGAVFGGASSTITDTLQKGLISSKREQVEESEKAQTEAASTAYEEAFSKTLSAASGCALKVGDPVTVSSDVRTKVRALNKAARAAGKTEFAESVPLSSNASQVQQGCSALQDALKAQVS